MTSTNDTTEPEKPNLPMKPRKVIVTLELETDKNLQDFKEKENWVGYLTLEEIVQVQVNVARKTKKRKKS